MTTLNFLQWEDSHKLPFPEEVKELVNSFNWEDFVWNSSGLPINEATYSLNGWKHLYYEADPTGKTVIQKQDDFNGEIFFWGYFVSPDKEEGTNYLITFKAVFLKGELIEVVLDNVQKHSSKTYTETINKLNEDFSKRLKRSTKWWYKYIYKWYSVFVRSIAYCLVWLCLKAKDLITYLALKITPL
jgi:hypothetical protein